MPSPTRVHVQEVEHEHEHHVIAVFNGNIPIVMQYNELLLISHKHLCKTIHAICSGNGGSFTCHVVNASFQPLG